MRIKLSIALVPVVLWLVACGSRNSDDASDLSWIQSRTTTTRYAYLGPTDLEDEFYFGARVTKFSDFPSSALAMEITPRKVKLRLSRKKGKSKLDILSVDGKNLYLSFEAKAKGRNQEIDFASAGNDVNLNTYIAGYGGEATGLVPNTIWKSAKNPEVTVQQDVDTVVVDLAHTVQEAVLTDDRKSIKTTDPRVGKVTVRIFLQRVSSLPRFGVARTAADGKKRNIGFFGSTDQINGPIHRLPLGDALNGKSSATFYLKEVPPAFQDAAQAAVLSWNAAFDHDSIKVATAPDGVDVGDPRFHVIKWFDKLDASVGWVGLASSIVAPDTGLVMGGNLYINGSPSQFDNVKSFVDNSHAFGSEPARVFSGAIGNVTFERSEGEAPVIPFMTAAPQGSDEFLKGFYKGTIAHELGHVLGLRHNFRGSTVLASGEPASVMDYLPLPQDSHYQAPGSYDLAAIRWGYQGQAPAAGQSYCTDEDVDATYDCNRFDWGDPSQTTVAGILDGTKLLTERAVAINNDLVNATILNEMVVAAKIVHLKEQLPEATRDATVARILAAISFVRDAKPDPELSGSARALVQKNLNKLREFIFGPSPEAQEDPPSLGTDTTHSTDTDRVTGE